MNALAYPLETEQRRLDVKSQYVRPSEAQVQAAVLEYLETDPRVAKVWRQNAGAMAGEHKGKKRFVRFVRDKDGNDVTVLDITGYLIDGRRLDIECKAQLPTDETLERWTMTLPSKLHAEARRFLKQRAVIDNARRCGCVAGFVTSVDDAKALIDAAGD